MPTEHVSVPEALHNTDFQNWLADHQILMRRTGPVNIARQSFRPGETQQTKLLNALIPHTGYLVAQEDLVEPIYGPDALGPLPSTAMTGNELKRTMEDPRALFHAHGVGWGLGIDGFLLVKSHIPVVYRLWENMYRWVDRDSLIPASYYPPLDTRSRKAADSLLRDVTRRIQATDIRIEKRGRQDNRQFRLTDTAEQELGIVRFTDYLPSYLERSFQDWLARDDVGILQRSKKLHPPRNLPGLEGKLLEELLTHRRYIVPLEYFAEALYGDERKTHTVEMVFSRLREKLPPGYIKGFTRLGVSVGVEEIRAPQQELEVLQKLFSSHKPVSIDTLALSMFGSIDHTQKTNIQSLISKIRIRLQGSAYEITNTGRRNSPLCYMLCRKDTRQDVE